MNATRTHNFFVESGAKHQNSNTNLLVLLLSVTRAGRLISPVSSTNKTDRHDITEIVLKVALNTTKLVHDHIMNISTISHSSVPPVFEEH
jgi:hypothetical protein